MGTETNMEIGHALDERRQLERIPEVFEGLVRERSVAVAARTCVVLLMGE